MQASRQFVLRDASVRRNCADYILHEAPEGWGVLVKEPTRSLGQNAAQWPILDAFSKQLLWPVNGERVRLEPEEFKDILTAAFRRETVRLAQAWDGGGVVMLGIRTSQMGKREFGEWLEFLNAAAAMKGVDIGSK